jgi:hypothetical protein
LKWGIVNIVDVVIASAVRVRVRVAEISGAG